jgi:hypothetical protein
MTEYTTPMGVWPPEVSAETTLAISIAYISRSSSKLSMTNSEIEKPVWIFRRIGIGPFAFLRFAENPEYPSRFPCHFLLRAANHVHQETAPNQKLSFAKIGGSFLCMPKHNVVPRTALAVAPIKKSPFAKIVQCFLWTTWQGGIGLFMGGTTYQDASRC